MGPSLRLAAWRLADAVVTSCARLARASRAAPRTTTVVLLVAAAALGLAGPPRCARPKLRIATFNIEHYGGADKVTNEPRLVELLAELDADVIAVQEIEDPPRFAKLVAGIGATGSAPARRSVFVPSRCGGKRGMHVGFVVDSRRVRLVGDPIEFPALAPGVDEGCAIEERPGLLAAFSSEAGGFELLVVHFSAGGEADAAARRREQWSKALEIVGQRRDAGGPPIAIIGDVNSAGFLDGENGERDWIMERMKAAGMRLPTRTLGCSEYYRRVEGGPYLRSLLDHVALSEGFPVEARAEVQGYCRELRCPAQLDSLPADASGVSDHCPVGVGTR